MRRSSALAVNYSSQPENLTQNNLLTDFQVREEFAGLIVRFPNRPLAQMSGVSRQAPDLWRRAERTISSPALLNVGKSIPSVRRWIAAHTDYSATDMTFDELLRGLHAVSAQNTPDGQIARQMLALAYQLRPPSAGPTTEQIARDGMVLIEKRIARGPEQDRATAERCEQLAREIDTEFEAAKDRDF